MPPPASFTIAHASFEGPLGVLLSLIESKQLDISTVSLATVTEDFAEHIRTHTETPLEERAASIVMLATLMLIKSRSLLPELVLTPEEELATDALEKRLALYAEIKRGAKVLKDAWGRTPLLGMSTPPARAIVFAPSADLTLDALTRALITLTRALPIQETRPETTVTSVVSIETMMDNIATRIERAAYDSFKKLTAGGDKATVIVSFLALLELVRHGVLGALQHEGFGDIEIRRES